MKKKQPTEVEAMLALGLLRSILGDKDLRDKIKKQWQFNTKELRLVINVANNACNNGIKI